MYDFPHRKNSIDDDCPLSLAFLREHSVSESASWERPRRAIYMEKQLLSE